MGGGGGQQARTRCIKMAWKLNKWRHNTNRAGATEKLTSCPVRSSGDRLPMLTSRLRYKELQLKERVERERGEAGVDGLCAGGVWGKGGQESS